MLEKRLHEFAATPATKARLTEASDLPFDTARDGSLVASWNGKRLHSYANPRAEASQIIAGQADALKAFLETNPSARKTILVFGPTLGYILDPLSDLIVESGHKEVKILCCEESPEIAKLSLRLKVWNSNSISIRWIAGLHAELDINTLTSSSDVFKLWTPFATKSGLFYNSLTESSGTIPRAERPMRILVPTPLYGGSYPIALHCRDAFVALGHQCELLDLSSYYPLYSEIDKISRDPRHRRVLQSLFTTYLSEMISAHAMDWKADLVWAVAQTPLTPSALQEMKSQGIHTAFWFVEDYRLFPYWSEVFPEYDAVFTIQRGEFHAELARRGIRNFAYLPCAANPAVHKPLSLTPNEVAHYGSRASFVGAGYPNRQRAFSALNLPDFKIWGNDWPNESPAFKHVQESGRRISTEESVKIYNATQININLHSSMIPAGSMMEGEFVNPRTFEIAACGGFQVVDRRSELANCFEEGKELVVFDSQEEISSLIEKYSQDTVTAKEIAARARARVLAEHTYEIRMKNALEFLESRLPRLRSRKRGPNFVSSLLQSAGDDQEMIEFLRKFDPNTEVTLDDIANSIHVGDRTLTRTEATFMLMKEFRDWGREKGVIV